MAGGRTVTSICWTTGGTGPCVARLTSGNPYSRLRVIDFSHSFSVAKLFDERTDLLSKFLRGVYWDTLDCSIRGRGVRGRHSDSPETEEPLEDSLGKRSVFDAVELQFIGSSSEYSIRQTESLRCKLIAYCLYS